MQSDGRRPLVLLDSASLYFRAFYGVPSSITAADGTSVNAIRGFLDMIAQLVKDRHPSRIVACWDDDWRPAFRVAAIPSYKEHRLAADGGEEVPEPLKPQVPIIIDVLAALGIARVGAPGFEADDVIGTLVARELAVPAGGRADAVEVVTGDRDLFQLVDDDAGVSVLYPAKGFKNLIVVDQSVLAEKYGVPTGAAYADMATLRGDPSDGLPGVAGIGEKTAASMLRTYGSLHGVLAAVDAGELSATQRTRISAARAYLDVAPTVVEVARDAPVGQFEDAVPTVPSDPDGVAELAERWNLGGAMTRVVEALTRAGD